MDGHPNSNAEIEQILLAALYRLVVDDVKRVLAPRQRVAPAADDGSRVLVIDPHA